jgi:hypothetical protein
MLDGAVWQQDDLQNLEALSESSSFRLLPCASGLPLFTGLAAAGSSAADAVSAGLAASSCGQLPPPAADARTSPFHASHDRYTHITFQEKKKKSAGGGADAAAGNQARASITLLVDTSVGWCLLEPEPREGRQAKRSR